MPLAKQKSLPSVQLIHGDCLAVMPTLPSESVQMVFADLPYGVLSCAWDCAIDLAAMWKHFGRIGTDGTIKAFTSTQPFTTALICSNKKQFKYDLVWCKNKGVGHLHANRRPMRIHETILIFASKASTYNAQKTSGHLVLPRTCQTATDKSYGAKILNGRQDSDTTRHPVSVLAIAPDNQRRRGWKGIACDYFHPTQKPVALLEWLIRTYTNEGDTVLDPTAGSMTTAIAALRTGRNAICIEKDAEYFRIGSERVATEQARLAGTP